MLHYETVDEGTLGLLKQLQSLDILSEMRLVGGTSLALQIGHRKSIDIDLFGILNVEFDILIDELKTLGEVVLLKNSKNIHSLLINDIKTPAMKLTAIMGRGSKKDFIDLYFILKNYTLTTLMDFYSKKYHDGSIFLVLKSLAYFEDADEQEMPFMFHNTSWQTMKNNIKKALADYILPGG